MRKRECRRMRNTRRLTNVDVFQKYFSLFPLNIYPFALSFFLYIFSVFVCLFGCVCACNLLPQLKSIDLLNSNLKHGIQWIACVARSPRILMLLLFVLLVGWLVSWLCSCSRHDDIIVADAFAAIESSTSWQSTNLFVNGNGPQEQIQKHSENFMASS